MLSLGERIVLAAGVAFIAALSVLLLHEPGTDSEGTARVGTITFRYRVAQRRASDRVIWEDVRQGSPVYNSNFVRTDSGSEAVVELDGGGRIELDPQSMVVLQIRDGEPVVELRSGSMVLSASRGRRVRVLAGEQAAVVAGAARLTRGPAGLDVQPSQGTTVLELSEGNRTLEPGTRASISRGRVLTETNQLLGALPEDNHRFFTLDRTRLVEFSWSSGANGMQLSRDRSFVDARSHRVAGGRMRLSLGDGIYYWRVGQAERWSEVRKFRILRLPGLELLGPAPADQIETVADRAAVWFRWRRHRIAAGYDLEVSGNPQFTNLVASRSVATTGTSLALPTGRWYWRVRTRASLPGAEVTSTARSILVTRTSTVRPPELRRPAVGGPLVATQPIAFDWKSHGSDADSELLVATDSEFTKLVVRRRTAAGFARVAPLAEGTYFWRVTDRYSGREGSWTSRVRSFVIQAAQPGSLAGGDPRVSQEAADSQTPSGGGGLAGTPSGPPVSRPKSAGPGRTTSPVPGTSAAPSRSAPAKSQPGVGSQLAEPRAIFPRAGGTVDMTTRESIPFAWRTVPGARAYRFALKRAGRELHSATTSEPRLTFADLGKLDVGDFSFEVEAVAADTRFNSRSVTRFRITLKDTLEKPELNIKR